LYRLEKGTPLDYTYVQSRIPYRQPQFPSFRKLTLRTHRYTYDEIKIILEGHFYIKDETGKEVKAEKGDVFLFPKGSRIIFRTDDYGLAFFVGQRERDTL